jgi:hypothetical protein
MVKKSTTRFGLFWVPIVSLRLEYRGKHTCVLQCGHQEWKERDVVLQCLGRCLAIYKGRGATGGVYLSTYTGCGMCDGYDFNKGPKHVVDFFNNLKILLSYDGY